ncbi:hypothetical protein Btru_070545 [Bulinus truncatus]|nr:hypothetical protein Btru_070545 [Bulinus truncatus]
MQDIIYTAVNENIRKRKWSYTETDRERYKLFSPLDFDLYSFFLSQLKEKLKSQKEEFYEELSYFRKLLTEVRFNCMFDRTFTIGKTQWHETFNVTSQTCDLLKQKTRQRAGMLYARVGIPRYGSPTVISQNSSYVSPTMISQNSSYGSPTPLVVACVAFEIVHR